MEFLQDIFFANLNVVCRAGGFFNAMAGVRWENGYHIFEQNKFYYITDGECSITIEEKEYIAKAGMWFFIPAGTRHKYEKIKGKTFKKFWMHFDVYPDSRLFDMLNLKIYVGVGKKREVNNLFSRYAEIAKSESLTDKIECKAILLNLIGEYIKLSDGERVSLRGEGEEAFLKILSHINENLNKPLLNSDMAELLHMHPNHFIRYFKGKTGVTPQDYITQKRMENAKRLLEKQDIPIAEIAEQVGMCDMAHFSKTFKKIYSMSPKQYRKNIYIEMR